MAPTRTIKNKHAGSKSGGAGGGKSGPKRSSSDGVSKPKGKSGAKSKAPATQVKGRPNLKGLDKKKKQRVYTEKELGIPELNMITPVGVTKPRGKKKGKVFVDDRVRHPPFFFQPPLPFNPLTVSSSLSRKA
jgi:60S ribosomal subunit assembly/export protein LOC1